jgi:hypothetical protein
MATQQAANMVLSLARRSFLHCYFERRKATGGNLAFPFSPSVSKEARSTNSPSIT